MEVGVDSVESTLSSAPWPTHKPLSKNQAQVQQALHWVSIAEQDEDAPSAFALKIFLIMILSNRTQCFWPTVCNHCSYQKQNHDTEHHHKRYMLYAHNVDSAGSTDHSSPTRTKMSEFNLKRRLNTVLQVPI